MSFRNRPVLDRKHRPRWQDELRTQQLIVAGFAVAIAVAIGIFGAAAWSDHYEAHLRPVAAVGDVTYDARRPDRPDGRHRLRAAGALRRPAATAWAASRDSLIQQGAQAIQDALSSLAPTAADSLVLGACADARARDATGSRSATTRSTAEVTQAPDASRAAEAIAHHRRRPSERRGAGHQADRRRLGARRGRGQRHRRRRSRVGPTSRRPPRRRATTLRGRGRLARLDRG